MIQGISWALRADKARPSQPLSDHSRLVHHLPGSDIGWVVAGLDLVDPNDIEQVRHDGFQSLGRITVIPPAGTKTVTHLGEFDLRLPMDDRGLADDDVVEPYRPVETGWIIIALNPTGQ